MLDQTIFNFTVSVNGKEERAYVLSEEGEGRDFHYRVKFSDAYEDVFHVVEDKLVGLRGAGSDAYAEAIKYDIHHYIGLNTDAFWYVFRDLVGDEIVNVWIFEEEDEDEDENLSTSWNVHYKKEYRFHLIKVGDHWMVSNKYEKDIPAVDRELSIKVEHLLKTIL
jgi:hypothetical protein